ncbi:MAG: Hsp20 family protein [Oscillospiraceae bacterium]
MLVPYARKNHTVSNFNPFHDFDELERAFFSDNALSEFKTDIQEDGDNFVLEADLPASRRGHPCRRGRRPSDRHRRAAFNFEDKDKKNKYVRCERSYGTYARSFDISGIDAKAIKAAYSDGVLRVTLPKQRGPRLVRRLEIE